VTCPELETIAAFTLDELDTETADAFEEHYFGCDACTARLEQLRELVTKLGSALPPILTAERRRALEAAHPGHAVVDVRPGQTAELHLGALAPVGLWVMHAPLAGVKRVDFEARDATGAPLFALDDVPFDAARGEVVLACQVHYRALPGTSRLEVSLTATDATGARAVNAYTLEHFFESA
jgi:anti-sigma factor RsiW